MEHNIKIKFKFQNTITGYIDDYNFAIKWENGKSIREDKIPDRGWTKGKPEYFKGKGITFLSISKDEIGIGGNPMLPSKTTEITTYVKFEDGEWINFSDNITTEVIELVGYITRIKSFGIV